MIPGFPNLDTRRVSATSLHRPSRVGREPNVNLCSPLGLESAAKLLASLNAPSTTHLESPSSPQRFIKNYSLKFPPFVACFRWVLLGASGLGLCSPSILFSGLKFSGFSEFPLGIRHGLWLPRAKLLQALFNRLAAAKLEIPNCLRRTMMSLLSSLLHERS
jgi:hypothetical protein